MNIPKATRNQLLFILWSAGPNFKVRMIKRLREQLHCGLKDAKDAIETLIDEYSLDEYALLEEENAALLKRLEEARVELNETEGRLSELLAKYDQP